LPPRPGIPARWVHNQSLPSSRERTLKYDDHLEGTGRASGQYADSLETAAAMGGMPGATVTPTLCERGKVECLRAPTAIIPD
jgi:hypothetical protein